MAIRNIVKDGDEILTKVCRPVDKFDEKLGILLDDMIETMKSADGVGLAAPQVGIRRRIVVIDVGSGPIEMVNPEIVEQSGEQECVEGCLSFPGQYGITMPFHACKVYWMQGTRCALCLPSRISQKEEDMP